MSESKSLELTGKVENVNLASLRIDNSYQRAEKANRKRIKGEFDPAAAGVLHVGRRNDGTLWVIDGQQRRWAMMQLGIKRWPAYVIHSSGSRYEAAVFNSINGKNRMNLTAQELFAAALEAQDPVAMSAKRAVEQSGLRLRLSHGGGDSTHENYLSCLGLLYRMTKRHGEEHTERVFKLITQTWPQQPKALMDVIPGAVSQLVAWQGDLIDDARFVDKLSTLPPVKIINDARTGLGHRLSNAQEVLLTRYNKGLRKNEKLKVYKHDSTTTVPEMVDVKDEEDVA